MESVKNPFKKKAEVTAAPVLPKKSATKAEAVEAMLREVRTESAKNSIHRTTLEIPSEVYEQIEAIRAETELSLKGFFMAAAKKYIADYYAKK
jgi:hypothetical protein